MKPNRRVLAESVAAALSGYCVAAGAEAALIRWVRPTEFELAWVSDVVLAFAFGVAVYLWRHLLTTRHELAEYERAELVVETQLSLAAEMQRRLLPELPPTKDGLEWAAALRTAGKIGGDFYDFIETDPGRWTVLVADVSGKGIPAAMALGSLRSMFRALASQRFEPSHIVTQLSAAFLQEFSGSPYVTCIVAAFDLHTGTVTYTNAGHPPGILAGPTGMRHLDRGGPPAGLLQGAHFEQERIGLHAGDTCLLITDGVTEALDATYSVEQDLAPTAGALTAAAALCDAVMTRALKGSGPSGNPGWDDDRTVVVVRVRDTSTFLPLEGRATADCQRRAPRSASLGPWSHQQQRKWSKIMNKPVGIVCLLSVVMSAHAAPAAARRSTPQSTTDAVRHELLQLPYYGVFDFLTFKVDGGTVTLMGYAYQATLKPDAERAARRAQGVDAVNNQVQVLPVSPNDDNLRWQTYYAIYRDPFLSRYAPGGGLLWGHRHAFPGGFRPLGPARFPGTEPAGDYPIHIVVEQGRITLLGVVDSESDKNVAGLRARGVPGSFGVENDLVIDNPSKQPSGTR